MYICTFFPFVPLLSPPSDKIYPCRFPLSKHGQPSRSWSTVAFLLCPPFLSIAHLSLPIDCCFTCSFNFNSYRLRFSPSPLQPVVPCRLSIQNYHITLLLGQTSISLPRYHGRPYRLGYFRICASAQVPRCRSALSYLPWLDKLDENSRPRPQYLRRHQRAEQRPLRGHGPKNRIRAAKCSNGRAHQGDSRQGVDS